MLQVVCGYQCVLIETLWNVKRVGVSSIVITAIGINRNIVECKVPLHLPQSVEALVLIETLWNVKKGGYVVKILGAEVY